MTTSTETAEKTSNPKSSFLVIVESPAKAKTIGKYLGPEYIVEASVGHVADLPSKGLAVDVENGFKPTYELTDRGRDVVKRLRGLMKNCDTVYLATDEDREGEAIAWHLLEHLKPKISVRRMVFHEITKTAIAEALANPRGIDYGLVDAADTRRILDRLYGYEVSPVLWRRVNRGLSAGRVQSPATRLVVERERERMAHVSMGYWDIAANAETQPPFKATLVALDGVRVATGKDFAANGSIKEGVALLTEDRAKSLAAALSNTTFKVRSVESKPYRSTPKPPFMTSTLQQEGGRKLGMSSAQVMRLAQGLYERGYITYMRTDAVTLAAEAITAVRAEIDRAYGGSFASPQVRTYASKVKNAQEAHEAIRPSLPLRSPESLSLELNATEMKLYRLIWQRTLASQMADANGTTVSVRLGAIAESTDCEFAASGTTITFPGYRQVYEESVDEESTDSQEQEALLPNLTVDDQVAVGDCLAEGHTTQPPARYTEASLVKKLEELGIGRPSTWANVMQTIIERGYVWKKGQSLVPTWPAFAVVGLMEKHFTALVDYAFTADVEEDLDEIAAGTQKKEDWLHSFYFGEEGSTLLGLKPLVELNLDKIDAAAINTFPLGDDPVSGEEVVVKPGKYGPYVKRGEDTAGVPQLVTPDELTLEKALELLALPKGDEPIGIHDGFAVYAKSGRFGPYVQWGDNDNLPPGLEKPKMVSLFKTMNIERISLEDAIRLLSLPRNLGKHAETEEPITAQNGKFGPYIQCGKEARSLPNEDAIFEISLTEALELLSQPRVFRGRGAPKPPLAEFGTDPISGKPVVAKEGKFGVYVTDGTTNASLTKGDRIEEMANERAYELLDIRRQRDAENGGKPVKKAAAKKAAPKKTAAKKKAAPKKKAAAKDAEPPETP
jgi:DNA topoisomerase-1